MSHTPSQAPDFNSISISYMASGVPEIIDPGTGKMDLAAMGFEDLKLNGIGPDDAEWGEHQSFCLAIRTQ